jgi:hypothetical protein
MIDVALQFIKGELKTYLVTKAGTDAVDVDLTKLVDEQGKYLLKTDHLGLTVVNFEEERIVKSHLPEYTYSEGRHVIVEPDLKMNLHLMFAANFSFYDQALKYLSHVLLFFHTNPSFTSEEYPALDPRLQKLTLELQNLSYDQLSQIWTFIGGKQLPAVVYKLRLVVLQPDTPAGIQLPLTTINASFHRP